MTAKNVNGNELAPKEQDGIYQTVEITKPDGNKWTFNYVTQVEYKSDLLFIWQESDYQPVTMIPKEKFSKFVVLADKELYKAIKTGVL